MTALAENKRLASGDDGVCTGVQQGFKQTEIGMLPQDWDACFLKDITIQISDGTHFTPNYVSSGIPFYSVENITASDFVNTKFISREEHTHLIKRCKPERGDILMTRITAGILGDTKLIDWDVDASIYVSLALIKIRSDINTHYVYCYTKSPAFRREVEKRGLINATPKKINMNEIGTVPVPVPCTPTEQQSIATALSDVDALIESLEKLIAKKRNIKKGVMQELLTGKHRLQGFTDKWNLIRVGDVVVRYFCGPSPTCKERNIQNESEWGVLKTTAITWERGWDWREHKTLPPIYWGRSECEIQRGDVIVTKAGPRHRVGVTTFVWDTPPRILVSGKMIALRPDLKKVEPMMLMSALAQPDPQMYLDLRTTGMAESQVNFENQVLLDAPITLPSLDEQQAQIDKRQKCDKSASLDLGQLGHPHYYF